MRLLTYNIRHGGVGREAALASVIGSAQPDLVVLQEATRPDVVEHLAALTGMAEWRSQRGQSLAFLSRTPVAQAMWYRPRVSRHAFLEIVLDGDAMRVFGVHLSAVHAAWTEQRRVFELRALLRSIARHQHGFHLLAGDFNSLTSDTRLDIKRLPPRLRPFVWLSGGRVKWRTVQTVLDAGYDDVYRRQHALAPGHTFPSWDPHLRLDYVFAPHQHRDRLSACDVVDDPRAAAASDHLPVVAEII